MSTLYHYTSEEGAEAIMESGEVKPSQVSVNGDAVLGDGVYLTRMGPEESTEAIAKNNWDGGANQAIADKKLDKVLEIMLTEEGAKRVEFYMIENRAIALYRYEVNGKAYPLYLNDPTIVKSVTVHDRTYTTYEPLHDHEKSSTACFILIVILVSILFVIVSSILITKRLNTERLASFDRRQSVTDYSWSCGL